MWDNYKSCSRQPATALPLFITSKNTDYRRTKIRHFSGVKKCPCPLLFSFFVKHGSSSSIHTCELLNHFDCSFLCACFCYRMHGQQMVRARCCCSCRNGVITIEFSLLYFLAFFPALFSKACLWSKLAPIFSRTLFVQLHNSNELVNHLKAYAR